MTETSAVLKLQLGSAPWRRVRFGVSPAEELLGAVQAAAMPTGVVLHRKWAAEASDVLRSMHAAELIATVSGRHYVPDFLTPPPDGPIAGISEQLERARSVSRDQVERELGLAFAGRRRPPTLSDAVRARDLLVDQFERCWHTLLEPIWSGILAVLEADIDFRAKQYADGGVLAVFTSLHRDIQIDGEHLLVKGRHPAPELALDHRGLLLIPKCVGAEMVGPILLAGWQPSLTYPARHRASWGRNPKGESSLDGVLGRTRARALRELTRPMTTTELSLKIGLAMSTTSQHLHALRDANLVSARREGRRVLYRLTEVGVDLVARSGGSRT